MMAPSIKLFLACAIGLVGRRTASAAFLKVVVYDGPTECDGAKRVKRGDKISMHFDGKIDESSAAGEPGKKIHSTRDGGKPHDFVVGAGHIVEGCDEGVIGMCLGSKARLVIPPGLGHGDSGSPDGKIPGGATLHFDVEIVAIGEDDVEKGARINGGAHGESPTKSESSGKIHADEEPRLGSNKLSEGSPETDYDSSFKVEVYEGPTECDGPNKVERGNKVRINFVGTIDKSSAAGEPGKKFGSSHDIDWPFEFVVGSGQAVKGADMGMVGLCLGAKTVMVIPPELGYGQTPSPDGKIPGGATLHFDVEVLAIGKGKSGTDGYIWNEVEGAPKKGWAAIDERSKIEMEVYDGPTVCDARNRVKKGDRILVNYHVTIDKSSLAGEPGKKLQSTDDLGEPFDFVVGEGQVVKGCDNGVIGMCLGAKAVMVIPPKLGWGEAGAQGGKIPGGATMNFDVEILAISKKKARELSGGDAIDKGTPKPESLKEQDVFAPKKGHPYKVDVYDGPTRCDRADRVKKGSRVSIHLVATIHKSSVAGRPKKKLHSTRDRGPTFDFVVGDGQLVKGCEDGLIGMCAGAKAVMVIPPELGYGEKGAPGAKIPGGATLNFDVEVVAIE